MFGGAHFLSAVTMPYYANCSMYLHLLLSLINFYRENAKRLLFENDSLQQQMSQSERDTIDVISFLKQEDMKKDGQVIRSLVLQ
jgi:hypothetical protein